MILLDTSICIDLLRGTSESASSRLLSCDPSEVKIPTVAAAELLFGARKGGSKKALHAARALIAAIGLAPFDGPVAEHYGVIRDELQKTGRVIGPNDMLIAATALSLGATVATANVGEFSRVPGLVVENWRDS